MRRFPFKSLRALWWAPLACYGLAMLLNQTDLVRQFEWRTLDWRTRYRVPFQPPPDPRLHLVLFDDDTEANLVSWPPPRQWHGQLIELVSVAEAKVLAMDVFITSERDPESDQAMAAGVQAARERGMAVISGAVRSDFPTEATESTRLGPTQPIRQVVGDTSRFVSAQFAALPIPVLREVSHFGFVDVPKFGEERVVSASGIPRTPPMLVRIGDAVYPSLSLATVMHYFDVPADRVRVTVGEAIYVPTKDRELRIPIDERGCLFLNYRYEALDAESVFPALSYRGLLLGLMAKYVDPQIEAPAPPDLKGAIVMVGLFETGNADAGPSPRAEYTPLPLVHLNAINNILTGDYAHKVPENQIWGLAVLLGYLGLLVLADRSVLVLMGGAVLGAVAYVALALWAWVYASWWFDLIAPLVGFGGLQFVVIGRRIIEEQRSKQEIKGMFGTYVSPELVERMVQSGAKPQLGGHTEEITAYFSDIQGYSGFSEAMPPARLVELLNEYLTVCTDILQEEGGTLDKYIGDAVVAMFGAPVPVKDHALRACVTALRVHHALDELRQRWAAQGEAWPLSVRQMRTRIGLNTGLAVVGNMGSRTRFNYTMTSDDVNLAARMESGAKKWGAYTLCTEATKAACQAHGGDRVIFRPLGRIVVKGRAQAVPIHELVGLKEQVAAQTLDCLGLFGQGLDKYHGRDWVGAAELFRRSAELEPNQPSRSPGVTSNPSLVFQQIVADYRLNPPPPEWNGVYVMHEK
ncbi:Adenylate cyclase 2 [Lacunisphaera limnophila]|uniref:Adenylate cyclase 2 n=1 Tax=Lacunisphaera limnophila TaxID=1838286 RepID=A0A1I7PHC0_9BACT|nr:adenylate/guanylate cyclase domain-containing protein [Lacunisphaera limnophila]AOS42996.1 Adenylate cyclase 2 [Lacunisphaera limnophila]